MFSLKSKSLAPNLPFSFPASKIWESRLRGPGHRRRHGRLRPAHRVLQSQLQIYRRWEGQVPMMLFFVRDQKEKRHHFWQFNVPFEQEALLHQDLRRGQQVLGEPGPGPYSKQDSLLPHEHSRHTEIHLPEPPRRERTQLIRPHWWRFRPLTQRTKGKYITW